MPQVSPNLRDLGMESAEGTASPFQPANKPEFQRLYRRRKFGSLGFTHKKMNMFGHHNVSKNNETVSSSNMFKRREKQIASTRDVKEWATPVAAERYEVKIASTVEALRMFRHVPKVPNKMGSVVTDEHFRCDFLQTPMFRKTG